MLFFLLSLFITICLPLSAQETHTQPRRSNKVAPIDIVPKLVSLEFCSAESYTQVMPSLPRFEIPKLTEDALTHNTVKCPLGNLHLFDGTIYTCLHRPEGGAYITQYDGNKCNPVSPIERERLTRLLTDENALRYTKLMAVHTLIASIQQQLEAHNHRQSSCAITITLTEYAKTYSIFKYHSKLYAFEKDAPSAPRSRKDFTHKAELVITLLRYWDGNPEHITSSVAPKKRWWMCC